MTGPGPYLRRRTKDLRRGDVVARGYHRTWRAVVISVRRVGWCKYVVVLDDQGSLDKTEQMAWSVWYTLPLDNLGHHDLD